MEVLVPVQVPVQVTVIRVVVGEVQADQNQGGGRRGNPRGSLVLRVKQMTKAIQTEYFEHYVLLYNL